MEHNYQNIDGWFNMENEYLELIEQGKVVVELGAWKGKSTSFIVTEIINRGLDTQFYTVDTFKGVTDGSDLNEIKAYEQFNLDAIEAEYERNTAHLKGYYTTIVSMSDVASTLFEDGSVDAIFIDAGHSYESVIKDLRAWYPKMRKGGLMAGHDFFNYEGVNKAVLEFLGDVDKVQNGCWFKIV